MDTAAIEAYVRREYAHEGVTDTIRAVAITMIDYMGDLHDDQIAAGARPGDVLISDGVTGSIVRVQGGLVRPIWRNW